MEGVAWSAQRIPTAVNFGFLDRSRYCPFQIAPQLSSRGWVEPVSDPLLLRKSGSVGNGTRDLWICSQELWPLDHRSSHGLSYKMQQKYVDLRCSCWYKSETLPEVYREFEAAMLHGAREDAQRACVVVRCWELCSRELIREYGGIHMCWSYFD
jgi:hypothetical protein